MKTYYRILDEKNDMPHTLFHGVNGSRQLPLDKWIEAVVKEVHDGTNGKKYQSGFHVLKTFDEVVDFLKKFKKLDYRTICKVRVDESAGIWKKEHSKADVQLVKKMRISKKDWLNRVNCKQLTQAKQIPVRAE